MPQAPVLTVRLLCVGRLKRGPEEALASRYVERAQHVARGLGMAIETRELSESRARRPADRKSEEADQIRAACGEMHGGTLIVFDERGRLTDSAGFAALLAGARDGATPLTLVIGGPDGLDDALRTGAGHVVALGAMTWPHQLARVLVAEQVYRAMTILAGHPYHRA